MMKLGGVILLANALVLARPVHGYPGNLACGRSITAGQGNNIMGAAVVESGSVSIKLQKGGTPIACGSSLTPGDTGLTFEVSGQGSQYVVEAIASAGMGSWGIQGGDCLNRRQINTVSNTYTVPGSGTVTVRVAGATAKGPVAVSPDCVYTVPAASTPKPPSSSTPSSPSYLQVIPSSPSASPPSSKTSTSKSTRNAISMILSYLLLHLLLAVIIYSYQ
jgi:hypothetical protein